MFLTCKDLIYTSNNHITAETYTYYTMPFLKGQQQMYCITRLKSLLDCGIDVTDRRVLLAWTVKQKGATLYGRMNVS